MRFSIENRLSKSVLELQKNLLIFLKNSSALHPYFLLLAEGVIPVMLNQIT